MKEEDINFIISRYQKKNMKPPIKEDAKNELSEKETIEIYNEILQILIKHNVSYKCALNISISLMYAFMTGAAELYDLDINT